MLSSTASRCGHPPGVHASGTSKSTSPVLLPLPPTGFVASPTQHGLGRSNLKSANDERLIQAIISSISYRLEKLSLSDEPVLEFATPTMSQPVYTVTPTGTGPTAIKNSSQLRLSINKPKLFERLSNGFRAGLSRSLRKGGHTKKPQAPIPPPLVSQCLLADHQDYLIGRRIQATGGLSVPDSIEVNPNSQVTQFERFTFASRETPAQPVRNLAFLQPASSDSPSTSSSTVWTPGDEVTDDSMDEDEQRSPSSRSPSPTPMDLEASTPSSNATWAHESPQAPAEVTARGDIHDSVSETADEVMSDPEQNPGGSEFARQTEPSDPMMVDASSTETAFSQEIDMVDVEDSKPSALFGSPATSSAQLARDAPGSNERIQFVPPNTSPRPDPAPVSSANVAVSEEQSSPIQPLPTSTFHQVEEVSSAASELNATNSPVASIQSTDPTPAPTANTAFTPAAVYQVVAPPVSAPTSIAGPSTPTPASAPTNASQMPGQATNEHASRVHQVLGRLRLLKEAPRSTQPPLNEEAEVKAFFDDLFRRALRRNLSKPQAKPAPPPPTSEPKQTKGSASRSLMDDIMAGFRKSSQKQITAAIRPSAQSRPTATNVPNTSSATQPAHQRPLSLVSSRQPDPQPTLPSSVVENSRYVVASPSGRAPATVLATGKVPSSSPTILSTQQASHPVVAGRQTCPNSPVPSSVVRIGRQVAAQLSGRAPCPVSATDKVNGPTGSIPTGAAISSEAHQPSSTGMDGIESGQRLIKGSGRVARAIRRTGLTWKLVQQTVQRNQAALDTAQANTVASNAMGALERDVEERRSQEWHAAQPPPPPEAIPYITTGEEYQGDENDHVAMINWLLTQED